MQSEIQPNFIVEKSIMIPMRDGVKLATDIYRPRQEEPVPALFTRLPYNKDTSEMVDFFLDLHRFLQAGYAVVIQDMRGCYASEGTFTATYESEPGDGADTIAWIADRPWSTGKVGMFGVSAQGETQWLAAKAQPPALKAIAPMHAEIAPFHYQGGAFKLGMFLWWALTRRAPGEVQRRIQQGRASEEEQAVLTQAAQNLPQFFEHLPLVDIPVLQKLAPYYFDWLARPTEEALEQILVQMEWYQRISIPVLHIGGWYDLFLHRTLEQYQGIKQQGSSATVRAQQHLFIGPWAHIDVPGIFPEHTYGPLASTRAVDLTAIHLRWFDHWLKGIDNGVEQEKPVRLFVMGDDTWREEEDWPLPDTQYRRYYLHSQGHANGLAGDGRLSLDASDKEPEDVYSYDPHTPVPTVGGANLLPDTAMDNTYLFNTGPRDQRLVEQREDVLCYTTVPLTQSVEVTGPIELVLSISSSAPDTDFTGKLVDVYPDGRAEILTDGILRARYRESLTSPVLMKPGHIYPLRINLGATSTVFKTGHCMRLEVSSSNFPRFNRNTNTGGKIISEREEQLQQAINRVYHDHASMSYLILPIIERTDK